MRSNVRRLLLIAVLPLVATACVATRAVDLFGESGRVWPAAPEEARVSFVGKFSVPQDLGIAPSFWERVVSVTAGEVDHRMVRPMAVAATSDGQVIFVADPDARCVHRYDLRKRRYHCIGSDDQSSTFQPVGVSLIDDAWLVVSDSHRGQLYKAGLEEKLLRTFVVSEPLERPTGLFWDAARERLFVTDTSRQSVFEFDREGNLRRDIGGRGSEPGKFNFPTYLWVDINGDLLVTDSLNFRMQRFDSEGRFVVAFGENGDHAGDFSRPKGVATDQHGHVYVIDALMHTIQLFNRKGDLLLAVGEQGQGDGQFWLPNGIFVTQDNRIFVADSYNQRVQVFRYLEPGS